MIRWLGLAILNYYTHQVWIVLTVEPKKLKMKVTLLWLFLFGCGIEVIFGEPICFVAGECKGNLHTSIEDISDSGLPQKLIWQYM